jgi:DNA-binding SARP family transcriptional activator
MGGSLVLAGQYSTATEWLDQALRGFQECSDPFGLNATRLWQAYSWFQQEEYELLIPVLGEALKFCQQNDHDYLFIKRTLLGPPDERLLVPLLVWARDNALGGRYPGQLLDKMGLGDIQFHPGYQLRVRTLGGFQVLRGNQIVEHSDWKREKTRQLWQLLLTFRQTPLDREQICEYLWPGIEPEAARRNFKVTLNSLYKALEPDRIAGNESAFVLREGTVYGVRPGCDIWLDIDDFGDFIKRAEALADQTPEQAASLYEEALALYQGEFLPDARYLDWSAVEREHLAVLYLQSADRYCELNLGLGKYQEVIVECGRILSQDSCWERAYRHLMAAYDGLGDHGQVARTYQRCVETMKAELSVPPSVETVAMYHRLIGEG